MIKESRLGLFKGGNLCKGLNPRVSLDMGLGDPVIVWS